MAETAEKQMRAEREQKRRQSTSGGRQELNGWSLDEFNATIQTVKDKPEAGKVTWRIRATWNDGFAADVRPQEITQLDQSIQRRFTIRSDHPPELLGDDTGPTAVEILLSGLAACITGTYAAHATARGIRIDQLEVVVEGQIDLNGFLQLSSTRPGFSDMRAHVRVKADAADDQLRELLDITRRASPVYDSVANPVRIEASVARITD